MTEEFRELLGNNIGNTYISGKHIHLASKRQLYDYTLINELNTCLTRLEP